MTYATTGSSDGRIREARGPGELPVFQHPGWNERFPWLIQGTTGRGDGADDFDLRLFGDTPVSTVVDRWLRLRRALGCERAAHARQVHGDAVLLHGPGAPGLLVAERFDGHATAEVGLLLTVSVADCVPISLVEPRSRTIALLHGGWRGVAAGIFERGVASLGALSGAVPEDFHLHLGPAICGACYEVGPEVFRALRLAVPDGPALLDLRRVLVEHALALGIPPAHITRSAFCTRCGDSPFFSHRGGCAGRQVGFLALRSGA